jgi:hypothetical protein
VDHRVQQRHVGVGPDLQHAPRHRRASTQGRRTHRR